jgi:hypothetical protein
MREKWQKAKVNKFSFFNEYNMLKHFSSFIAILLGVLFILGTVDGVQASEYNTSSLIVSGVDYNSPNFDCKSSDECLLIAHNNATNIIWGYYTLDGFTTINRTFSIASWTPDSGATRDNYPYTYDVFYRSGSDSYYIANERTLYDYYPSNTTLTTVCTISGGAGNTTGNSYHFVGVYNATTNLALKIYDGAYQFDLVFIDGCNQSLTHNLGTVYTSAGYSSPANLYDVSGFVGWKDTITSLSDVAMDVKTIRHVSVLESFTYNLGTFPDSYDGMWHYTDNKVYYRNSTYIKTASTTDFSSWGSPVDYWVNSEGVIREDRKNYATFDVVAFENASGIHWGNTYVAPAYTPAEEYVSGNWVYTPAFWWLGAKAYSPKVACEQDMQHCLMLVYDTTAFFGGLLGFYSVDGFQTPISFPPNANTFHAFTVPSVVLTEEVLESNLDYQFLPYDLWYNDADGEYYLMTTSDTQSVKRYKYSQFAGLRVQSQGLSCRITDEFCYHKPLQIRGKETSQPEMIILNHFCGSSILPSCSGFIDLQRYYLINGTYITYTNLLTEAPTKSCPSAGFGTTEQKDIDELGGFVADTLDYLEYEIYGDFSCNGIQQYDTLQAGTFPTTSLGYDYYKEGQDFVYKRAGSGSVAEGNWYTSTGDFTTYSAPQLYYAWDKASGEIIHQTDRTLLSGKRVYVFERTHYSDFGIYAYIEEVFPIYVFGRYTDPITGAPDNPVNQSVTLTCPSGYTTTDIDADALVYTTCDTAMNMSIYTSGFIPTSGALTFDIPAGCTSSMFMYVDYLPQTYSPNITIRDGVTGSPVSGATVKLDNVVQGTTDANGLLQLTVNPIQSPSFVQSTAGCGIYLDVTGTPREYWLQASATGFRTTNDYSFEFAEQHVVGNATSYTYKTEDALNFYLDRGSDVLVRVYTFDGVQVEGNLVSVKSEGANQTLVMINDVPTATDTATSFPATFRLVDDRASWSANFTLTQGNHTESQNITIINTTTHYTLSFTLPDDSDEQPCNTILDCTESYCIGNYYYDLQSCTGGLCVYDVESCILCDDEAGCYNTVTTETCYFDSECYDLIECVNTAVLQDARCGETNVCVLQQVECTYGCEDDVCVGAPTVVECDQSSVVGMLQCMQAGILNFFGSTYDPMFAIVTAIFVAILIITLLAIGFKGFSRVIG